MDVPLISILIPTYNERRLMVACLQHLRQLVPRAEIIVADGMSSDGTARLAMRSGLADQVMQIPGGRAAQLNQAVVSSHGELIVCCPVDVRFSLSAFHQLLAAVKSGVRYGCFYQRSARQNNIFKAQDYLARLRARLCGNAYMDQVPFCLRHELLRVGGFRDRWSYDTADLFRRIGRGHYFKMLSAPCVSSCRAWSDGFWRQWWQHQRSRLRYFAVLLLSDQSYFQ